MSSPLVEAWLREERRAAWRRRPAKGGHREGIGANQRPRSVRTRPATALDVHFIQAIPSRLPRHGNRSRGEGDKRTERHRAVRLLQGYFGLGGLNIVVHTVRMAAEAETRDSNGGTEDG